MSLPISPIRPPLGIDALDIGSSQKPGGGSGAFQSLLSDAIGRVQNAQQASQSTVEKFLAGENEEIHTIAIQSQQAELAFDMFMQVRNKVVAAYQEVMRMQM